MQRKAKKFRQTSTYAYPCLLYTSPSPRDGHLSIRRQRQDVYKRQNPSRAIFVAIREIVENSLDAAESQKIPPDVYVRLSLSLIHISEPTRRTPLYSSAASGCV